MPHLHVLKRAPRSNTEDYILVDRYPIKSEYRWVVGTVSKDNADPSEWVWGHYYPTLDDALAYFNACVSGS